MFQAEPSGEFRDWEEAWDYLVNLGWWLERDRSWSVPTGWKFTAHQLNAVELLSQSELKSKGVRVRS
jgi:hypothetical protein